MTTAAIRQKLYEYIRVADDKKVKAIYTIVAEGAEEGTEWWRDKKLVEKLNAIDSDMESGKDEGVNWAQAKDQLLAPAKK